MCPLPSSHLKILTCLLFLVLLSVMTHPSAALPVEAMFYVADKAGIHCGKLDAQTGALSLVDMASDVANPFWLTFTPDGKYLYAAIMSKEGEVGAFRVEKDGKLTLLNKQSSSGKAPCHLCLDAKGRHILVATYTGGNASVLSLLPDGSLGERMAHEEFMGSGPDPKRQKKPYAHGIYTDASGKFVYVCDLGTDSVWIYRLDEQTGALIANDPPVAKTPAGSGPRHLAMDANERFVYVNGEMGMDVTVFAREPANGALTPIQTISTLPEGASREGTSTSEIAMHPSQKFLYVANRGHDSITSYIIGADGKLTWIENVSAGVKFPYNFVIDPSGKWLIAGGQEDGKLASFAIDSGTGKLMPTGNGLKLEGPFHIVFAPQK